ncbi:hypothetical protein E2C01_038871 [Portunus trituberculatus]|uniref:Uncharacterized protein n=1 Tax=Portunus trituberculatus TaxID=210409 RepID=A0A5B7FC29_PORTR|nr:hypothetical protein [Portunus trituberculatus]
MPLCTPCNSASTEPVMCRAAFVRCELRSALPEGFVVSLRAGRRLTPATATFRLGEEAVWVGNSRVYCPVILVCVRRVGSTQRRRRSCGQALWRVSVWEGSSNCVEENFEPAAEQSKQRVRAVCWRTGGVGAGRRRERGQGGESKGWTVVRGLDGKGGKGSHRGHYHFGTALLMHFNCVICRARRRDVQEGRCLAVLAAVVKLEHVPRGGGRGEVIG